MGMKEEDRCLLLSFLTANQYQDIMHVCASLPFVEMKVDCLGIFECYCINVLPFLMCVHVLNKFFPNDCKVVLCYSIFLL